MKMYVNKEKENKIINIIKKGFEHGYSKTDKIIRIMYALFPEVDLIYCEEEEKKAEKIYNIYSEKIINGVF